jgi:hypothetical protein
MGAIAAIIAGRVLPITPTPGTLMLSASLFAFVIATWLLMRQHDRHLCEWCAASIPLNPSEQAARYHRRLWTVHTGSNPRYLVPYVIVLVGSNLLTSYSGRLFWAVAQSSMIYLIAATTSHRKLQPWCPWCKGDGGGDDVLQDDPDLPRGDRRQLV